MKEEIKKLMEASLRDDKEAIKEHVAEIAGKVHGIFERVATAVEELTARYSGRL